MNEEDTIIEEAAAWHFASKAADMDWDAFARWLEADSRHRAAFDGIALTDAAFAEHRGALASAFAANDDSDRALPGRTYRWLRWCGSGIAIALVALLAFRQFAPHSEIYQTGGQSSLITLEDGSKIQLAPDSRLEVDGADIDLAGGAWFDIRHDPARQLSVRAGGIEITDIGTKFDVQDAGGEIRVEVAEGKLRVSSDAMARPVELSRGRALAFDPKGGTAAVSSLTTADIGGWRAGRLSFEAASLTLVAADLSRYSGVKITVADNLGDRHFTGTLAIRDREAALRDLSLLMDLALVRTGDGYRLERLAR